ncbi:MAG: histidine phosphatase family protein [Chlorobium sp.]|jgi:phosphohistidine phosphatase|nr:histidine phosphatase family protein [Chlorobium sp.]
MKTIYIVRHAKAGSGSQYTGDFDRRLNEVGLKAAHVLAGLLEERSVAPDLVITSPATRSLSTAEIFCEILGYPKDSIEKRMEIYEGGAGRLMTIVQQLEECNHTIMLFGHNPTVTAFSNLLSGSDLNSMATCGVVCLDFNSELWSDAHPGCCKLVWYDYPKQHQ